MLGTDILTFLFGGFALGLLSGVIVGMGYAFIRAIFE